MLLSLDLGALKHAVPLALFINYGMLFTTKATSDDAVLMSAALEYHPVSVSGLVVELNSEMRYENFSRSFSLNKDPLHIVPEIVITPQPALCLPWALNQPRFSVRHLYLCEGTGCGNQGAPHHRY